MSGGTPLGNMVIQLGLDSTKMTDGLTKAKFQLKNFERQVKAQQGIADFYKRGGEATQAYTKQQEILSKAIETQSKLLRTLKKDYDVESDANGAMSKRAQRLAGEIELGNAKLAQLAGQLRSVAREGYLVESKLLGVGKKFSLWSDRLSKFGSAMDTVSSKTQGMTGAIVAGFALSTKQAAEFQHSMQETQALLADTVPAHQLNRVINQLSESSKQWAMDYGLSTKSVNEGMQELVKAGYDANQVVAAMPAILNASKASGENFNTVMEATSSILSQYKLSASEASRVTDSLTFVANKTKAGFADMGLAMEYVGPVAHSLGMSVEETAAAIGLLSNNGIAGEKAGTALRGALTRLLKPSKQNAVAMKELGFSAEEFRSGALKLPDIIDRIKSATQGWTDAERAAVIARAFGTEAQTGMNALINEGSKALRTLAKETEGAEGYTKRLADTMNQSAQAKFAQAKAKLEVLAITIGERLLPTIIPLVEDISELVKSFTDLPGAAQENIIQMALLAASISPVSKILGTTAKGVSLLTGGIGNLLKKMADIGADRAADIALKELGIVASSSAGQVAGLTSGISGASGALAGASGNASLFAAAIGPGGVALAVTAAAAVLTYFAGEALAAQGRVLAWGTEVDKVQARELSTFKDKVDETNRAMTTFGVEGKQGVEDVRQAFQGLVDDIAKLSDKNLAKNLKLAEQLGLSPETIEAMKRSANNVVDTAQKMADDAVAIYQKHNNDRKQLTEQEKAIVLNAQNELIRSKLELEGYSSQEIIAITKAMNGELSELNQAQVNEHILAMSKWMSEEKKSYNERKASIKEALAGLGSEEVAARAELHQKLEALESEHTATMEAYLDNYLALRKRSFDDQMKFLSDNKLDQSAYLEATKQELEALGVSYEEFLAISSDSLGKSAQSHSLWAETVAGATEDTRKANDFWNNLTWKDGEIKTNAKEVLAETLQTAEGWEQMQFVLKHANLDTNARVMIAEALIANGEWEKLSPAEKRLVVGNNQAIAAITESKDLMAIWNGLPENVKKLLGDNSNFIATEKSAREFLQGWNALPPDKKELLAEDLTANPTQSATEALNNVKQIVPADILAIDKTSPDTVSAQAKINSVKQSQPADILALNRTGHEVSSAQSAISSVRQHHPTTISALDNASSVAGSIKWSIDSIPTYKSITISAAYDNAMARILGTYEHGTDFHPGGLAMVNDQKGPLYKELVTLPTGESFIPQGRDVILPLPRGSKVLTASRTRVLMNNLGVPKYAEGVGYSVNSPLFQALNRTEKKFVGQVANQQGNGDMIGLIKAILAELKRPKQGQLALDVSGQLSLDNPDYRQIAEVVGRMLAQEMQRQSQLKGMVT